MNKMNVVSLSNDRVCRIKFVVTEKKLEQIDRSVSRARVRVRIGEEAVENSIPFFFKAIK